MNTISNILKKDPKCEILVLTVPMKDFAAFVGDLKAILTLIQKSTSDIFIPICISHSPIKPDKDFIVAFRSSQHVQSFSLDGWFTTNIDALSKKFIVKTKVIRDKDHGDVKMDLDAELKAYYTKEKLNLIGGFQDSNQTLQLLFFK